MIRKFAREITVEQIAKAARAQVYIVTVFWLLLLAIFTAITIYQLTILGMALDNKKILTMIKVISITNYFTFNFVFL